MKNTKLLILVILLILNLGNLNIVLGQCKLDKTGWELIFSEDFESGNIESLLQNQWIIGDPHDPGNAQILSDMCPDASVDQYSCNVKSMIDIEDGFAFLNIKKTPSYCWDVVNNTYVHVDYLSSFLSSTFDEFSQSRHQNAGNTRNGFVYGMFEINCKLPKKEKGYPAFWLSGNSWPPEIDVFEHHTNTNEFFSSTHWTNSINQHELCSNFYNFTYDLTDDFHKFTLVWTPTEIAWFFDDVLINVNYNVETLPGYNFLIEGNYDEFFKWTKMHLILSYWPMCPNNNYEFDPFVVDYIKVYKPIGYEVIQESQLAFDYYNSLVDLYANTKYKTDEEWVTYKVNSENSYEVSKNMKGVQGGGKFYFKGTDNYLWNTYWSNGKYFSDRVNPNILLTYDYDLALNGEMIVYGQKQGFNRFLKYRYNNNTYSILNANALHNNTKIAISKDGLKIVYVDSNNKIVICSRNSINAHNWDVNKTNISANPDSKVIFDTFYPNSFFYEYDNTLYQYLYYWGLLFKIFVSIEGEFDTDYVLTNDGNSIIYINSDGVLKKANRNSYHSWQNELFNLGNNNVLNYKSGLSINQDSNNLQLYFQGYDNTIWSIYWDEDKYNLGCINCIQKNIKNDFQVIKQGIFNNEVNIAYTDVYNKIRVVRYSEYCNVILDCDNNRNDVVFLMDNNDSVNSFIVNNYFIYPNPFSSHFNIQGDLDNIQHLLIYDLLGREMLLEFDLSDKNLVRINTESLNEGIYILVIYGFEDTEVFKIHKI